MQSRIFGIKKINVLRFVTIINLLLFIVSIFFSIYVLFIPKLWFDFYCVFVGTYLLTKAFLYKSDSNCYFGFLLLFLGAFLFLNTYFNLDYLFIAIVLSFCLASVMTYLFTHQIFHIIYGANFLFWCFDYYIFRQEIVNIYIFFVIMATFTFLFSLIYAKIKIREK